MARWHLAAGCDRRPLGNPPALPAEAPAGGIAGHGAFGNLRRILFKVQPPLVPAKRGLNTTELSANAAQSIRGSAEGITDEKLRAALERLANNASRKKSLQNKTS